ncbi:MAG: hypothetical protein ACMUJM_19910 [bacterium]
MNKLKEIVILVFCFLYIVVPSGYTQGPYHEIENNLLESARIGDAQSIKNILKKEVDVNAQNKFGKK